jgi:carboxyl-terminal processing protease
MPDVFVPQDTIGYTSYSSEIFNNGLSIQFAFQYTDANRDRLKKYDSYESLVKYLSQQGLVEQLVRFADGKGVKRRNILIQKSYKLLERSLYGNIIYNMLGREEYIKYLNEFDTTVLKAVDILKSGEAFPKAPEKPVTPNKKSSDGKQKRTA